VSNDFKRNVPLLQAVTCILGLEGGEDGINRLAEELTIGLNPWSGDNPEFALCRADFLFAKNMFVAAGGVGNRSLGQLHNDSLDNLLVLEKILAYCAVAAGSILISRTNLQATTDVGLTCIARDGRYPRPSVPAARLRSQNNAALAAGYTNGIQYELTQPVTLLFVSVDVEPNFVVRPQDTITVFPATDNTALGVTFIGRVRRTISPRELAP
jgi:hypothetical protein